LIELKKLTEKENLYLKTFMPLLNILMKSNIDPRIYHFTSALTRYKISQTLLGKKHIDNTRTLMNLKRSVANNQWYGKILPQIVLDAAANKNGKRVFVYDSKSFNLINDKSFRSLRSTVKILPISIYKFTLLLESGIPYKKYYYFSTIQKTKPN